MVGALGKIIQDTKKFHYNSVYKTHGISLPGKELLQFATAYIAIAAVRKTAKVYIAKFLFKKTYYSFLRFAFRVR